jgi:hypothetical protein
MIKKIKRPLFIITFLVFILLNIQYYLSEKNVKYTNKSRSLYQSFLKTNKIDLPILKSDTNKIIVYKNDLDNFKNNRKKRFWEDLISNKNE